ncbi:MAG: hypothetical protein KJN99_11415 [Marinicaulis sp.]|nr:hypothetical protein [Marinicaulis sp.]
MSERIPASAIGLIAAVLLMISAAPASAATTVFGASVFSETGVTGAGLSLGVADGAGSVISGGGVLVLEFSAPVVGDNILLTTLNSGFLNIATVAIGHVVGGTATFSAAVPFVEVTGGDFAFDLSGDCAAIAATGCSLLRISTTTALFSPGLSLDGVSGVSGAPEPGTWALLIIGFVLVAGRLKAVRRETGIEASRSDVRTIAAC